MHSSSAPPSLGSNYSNDYQIDPAAAQRLHEYQATHLATFSGASLFPSTFPFATSHLVNSAVKEQKGDTQEAEIFRKQFNAECQKLRESLVSSDQVNLYSLCPSLADIKTPLRDCLELDRTIQKISGKFAVKTLREPQSGLSGRVKFVRFANDLVKERWFAIKCPKGLGNLFARLSGQEKKDDQAAMNYYRNNLEIALKIGNHPNFMQVHGVIVKEKKQGKSSKPYLIMEYIEGKNLNKLNEFSESEVLNLVAQLKNAFIRLYECKIIPGDANNGNFIVTPDHVIKMIDFDAWKHLPEASPQDIGQPLYDLFCLVVTTLQGRLNLILSKPTQSLQDKEVFAKELEMIFAQLSSPSHNTNDLYAFNDIYDLYS